MLDLQKLIYFVCFHIGPLGFNISYEFTDGDLRICMNQLSMFLMEYTEIAYKVFFSNLSKVLNLIESSEFFARRF